MLTPILLIGDSITEEWANHRAGTFAAHGLIGRGASGQTARWVAMRFRRDLEETGAQGVHLLCGINDIGRNEGFFVSVEDLCGTLAAMLDEARAMGVTAWIGSLTPAAAIPWNPEVTDAPAMVAAVNAWLRDHAVEHGATYIDYFSVLADEAGALRPEYGRDGLHLSAAGYEAIEPRMLTALGRIAPPEPAAAAVPESPRVTPARPYLKLAAAVVILMLALAAVLWATRPATPIAIDAPIGSSVR